MKYLIFFVSLLFASCNSSKEFNQLYSLHQRGNSLYITTRGSNNFIKVTEGSLATSSFLRAYERQVKAEGHSDARLKHLYEYYKLNSLDSADCIFYVDPDPNLWKF